MTILRKSIQIDLKSSVTDQGNFSGYGSVFNVIDKGGDIVMPGAFAESLTAWGKSGRTVPVLWQHDPGEPIGIWQNLKEDDHGLFGEASLWLEDAPRARVAHRGMKDNAITGLSIGYRVKKYSVNPDTKVYSLEKLDLVEISVVTNPMNDDARVENVKSMLAAGILPTLPQFEKFLCEAGFSNNQAKAVAGHGLKKLLDRCEADSEKGDSILRVLREFKITL